MLGCSQKSSLCFQIFTIQNYIRINTNSNIFHIKVIINESKSFCLISKIIKFIIHSTLLHDREGVCKN